jgi:hypothetical protein
MHHVSRSRAFSCAAVIACLTGCYYGAPNLSAVVDKRSPGTDGVTIAQVGYEQAGDYVQPGTGDSPTPTVLGYRGYNGIVSGSMTGSQWSRIALP